MIIPASAGSIGYHAQFGPGFGPSAGASAGRSRDNRSVLQQEAVRGGASVKVRTWITWGRIVWVSHSMVSQASVRLRTGQARGSRIV